MAPRDLGRRRGLVAAADCSGWTTGSSRGLALLAGATLTVYGQTLGHGFVWDDAGPEHRQLVPRVIERIRHLEQAPARSAPAR